jgi:GDP-L-fucose synthase
MNSFLITGGSGMVGTAFKKLLPNAIYISSQDYDLRERNQVDEMYTKYKPEYVIHLASRVGGVLANMQNLGDYYYDNIMINTNVLDGAKEFKVKKLLSCLSTCVYPDNAVYPLTEEQIHSGAPHSSNYAYAHTKRMIDIQSRAYRQQFGCNFISMTPNNLFGENDNFDLLDSHAIPAMIRKIYEAKQANTDVIMWGDGTPLREFTYIDDICRISLFLLSNYDNIEPINIGTTGEQTISEVANKIASYFDFTNNIIWDTSKPKGQHRKPSDNSKLLQLGWKPEQFTKFDDALQQTCKWFSDQYPNVRGVKQG